MMVLSKFMIDSKMMRRREGVQRLLRRTLAITNEINDDINDCWPRIIIVLRSVSRVNIQNDIILLTKKMLSLSFSPISLPASEYPSISPLYSVLGS